MNNATRPDGIDAATLAYRDAAARWFADTADQDAFRRHLAGSRADNRAAWEAFRGFGLAEILADSTAAEQARIAAAVGIEAGRALFAGPLIEGCVRALCGAPGDAARLEVFGSFYTSGGGEQSIALVRPEDTGRARGTSAPAPYANLPDRVIVPIRFGGSLALGIIDPGAEGVTTEACAQIDGSSLVSLSFDCAFGPDDVIASGPSCATTVAHIEELLLISTSARLIGVAERTGEITREYLGVRRQFGKVLGGFQALQHRAVDGHIDDKLANALLWRLAADWDNLANRRALLLALKSLASKTAMKLTRDGVQMFGGMGFSDEGPIGIYLKHAMVLAARYGSEVRSRHAYSAHALDLME